MVTYNVKVPATTANMGPGFDAFGMALSLYSYFEAKPSDKWQFSLTGAGADQLDGRENLVETAMKYVLEQENSPQKAYVHIENHIPFGRGLGSSAAAIVGGVMLANALLKRRLTDQEILRYATTIEGHPDNVVPAYLGQFTVSLATEDRILCEQIMPSSSLTTVVCIPTYEVSTAKARAVMPPTVSMEDAVFSMTHASLLVLAMRNGDLPLLSHAMKDRLHEPYRKALLKGYDSLKAAALDAGALSYNISGSGSTTIAYTDQDHAVAIAEALRHTMDQLGLDGQALTLPPDMHGAVYQD